MTRSTFLTFAHYQKRSKPGSALVYVILATAAATAIALTSMGVVLKDSRYPSSLQASNEAEEMVQSAIQEGIAVLSKNLPTASYEAPKDRQLTGDNCDTWDLTSVGDCPRYTVSIYNGQLVDGLHSYEIWTSDIKTAGYTQDFVVTNVSGNGLRLKKIDKVFSDNQGVKEMVCIVKDANGVPLSPPKKLHDGEVCEVGNTVAGIVTLTMTYKSSAENPAFGPPLTHQPVVLVESKDPGSIGLSGRGKISFGNRVQIYAVGYSKGNKAVRRYGVSYYYPSYAETPGGSTSASPTIKSKPISGVVDVNGVCSVTNACR